MEERQLPKSKIQEFAERVEKLYDVASPDLIALGRELYDWLDGPTERWMAKASDGAEGLAIHIHVADQLRHLPWELMFAEGNYLCNNLLRPFTPVRFVTNEHRGAPRNNRPLRVLFMACSAEDVKPVLSYEGEERLILDAARRHQIDLVVEESGSLDGLRQRVRDFDQNHFDVFHLTGHADVKDDQPYFIMENDLGFRQNVTAEEIAQAFEGNWPRLVFLSGCRTGQAAGQGALPSLCEALVRAGAPAVLGWALPVGDISASVAAAALYEHLATGKRLDESAARARQKLFEEGSSYWHLLRLYANDTPLAEMVTPLRHKGRKKLKVREAAKEFIDAGANVEVCRREFFVGRRRPIQRCLRALRSVQSDDAYFEGVLLHGMGGLGKSSLAVRLCERMHDFQRIVFVGRIEELNFLTTLNDRLASVEAIEILEQPKLKLRQRLRNLLEGPLADRSVLFVFDDFEHSLDLAQSGDYVLQPQALDVLGALLAAIRETASDSRVIITSRYGFAVPGKAKLYEEGLESMRDADLDKKLAMLDEFEHLAEADSDLRDRAVKAGAGNPRLLERLNKVLADAETDHDAILLAIEATQKEFREEVLLSHLLGQQTAECRKLIALISVFGLPADRAAVGAAAGSAAVDPHLERAVSLGLVEAGKETGTEEPRYYVSTIMQPLLEREISESERAEACSRAAKHLHQELLSGKAAGMEELLEVHRLALIGGEKEIAVTMGDRVAMWLVNSSRFREAEMICLATLTLGDDYRILNTLARAGQVLGKTVQARQYYEQALVQCPKVEPTEASDVARVYSAILHNLASLLMQQGEVKRAMELWEESVRIAEQVGDMQGKSATLHEMGRVYEQQGEIKRAMELWEESVRIDEQIGDMRRKAATLHEMAGVYAQQGDSNLAMELLEKSFDLQEQIGDVHGRSATLHEMAGMYAQQGKNKLAMELLEESLKLLDLIGDLRGKAATLHEMAGVHARQGERKRAIELWEESIKLKEQIGDVRGKATTLANMAWIEREQGNHERKCELCLEAARLIVSIHAWPDLVPLLRNLGASDDEDGTAFLAQALWLCLRVGVSAESAVRTATAIFQKVGPESDAAPLIATAAHFMVMTRGENHPEKETLQKASLSMLAACANARSIAPEKFNEWIESEGLDDLDRFVPALDTELEKIVGEREWLFDRRLFQQGE